MSTTAAPPHPMTVPTARRWWAGRAAVLLVSDAIATAAVVVLLLHGLTPVVFAALVAVVAVSVAASITARWMRWRALTEVPGAWWGRAPSTSNMDRVVRWTQRLDTFAVAWALIAASSTMRAGVLTTSDARTVAWWFVIIGISTATPFILVRSRGRCSAAWTLMLVLAIAAALVPTARPVILPAVGMSLLAGVAAANATRSTRRADS